MNRDADQHGMAGAVRGEPDALDALDAATVRRWASASVRALQTHRAAIDAINVYPVADADTGTNLLHTMRSAVDSVLRLPPETGLSAVLRALAAGALAGARGNSGVILSQVLRGFAEALDGYSIAGPGAVAEALAAADRLATAAVSEPVAGTMLTVLHEAASIASRNQERPLAELLDAVADAAGRALANTPRQLAVLSKAGVVDAGAQGISLLLDELVATAVPRGEVGLRLAEHAKSTTMDVAVTDREGGSPEYGYEVMYLLDEADELAAARLREALRGLGDCVSVVTDGGGLWNVHVHCNNVGAAIEAGIDAGRPRQVKVARFAEQTSVGFAGFATPRAVVALVVGAGSAELFRAAGAEIVVLEPAERPTAAELLAAISGTRAAAVTVLTNEPELADVAADAAALAGGSGQRAVVVPTFSPVQGLAALAVHDPGRRAADDDVAMAEAAAATRRGALAVAEEEALTWAGRCQRGDILGMVDGEVVFIEPMSATEPVVLAAACRLLDRMLAAGGELVTALLGVSAPQGLADALESHLREEHPEMDFAAYPSGRTDAVLLIGVE